MQPEPNRPDFEELFNQGRYANMRADAQVSLELDSTQSPPVEGLCWEDCHNIMYGNVGWWCQVMFQQSCILDYRRWQTNLPNQALGLLRQNYFSIDVKHGCVTIRVSFAIITEPFSAKPLRESHGMMCIRCICFSARHQCTCILYGAINVYVCLS